MLARAAFCGLLTLIACDGGGDKSTPTDTARPTGFNDPVVLTSSLPGGLLSVQALASDDVWAVGASSDPDDNSGPWVLHYNGDDWSRLDLSAWPGAELWWGFFIDNEMVLVGSGGLILQGERDATLTPVEGPNENTTFYGVWGASSDDIWAVGADTTDDGAPVVWRRQAGEWAPADLSGLDGIGDTIFKVNGTQADDVWFVGSQGTAMHWDGSAFNSFPTGFDTSPILTVETGGERPYAVGGFGNGLILEFDGTAWIDASPEFQPGFNGVCAGAGYAWTVGQLGARAERVDGAWTSDVSKQTMPLITSDWHGCDIDEQGGLWMVGGRIASRPLREGALAYYGPDVPPAISSEL
jgi:hypothetical protein